MAAQLEQINCPNCDDDASSVWANENGFTAVKCNRCSLVYVNPRPTLDFINESNMQGVHKGGEADLDVTASRKGSRINHYSLILSQMFGAEIFSKKPLHWLDVGAGYGEFIESVVKTMPAESNAMGIEPMLPKVKVAQKLGLPISNISLEDIEETCDVISLINVYSHIPDFKSFVLTLKTKMKNHGILFIETGNVADLKSRDEFSDSLFLPDHLVFGGYSQITNTLRQVGFDLVGYQERPVDNIVWCLKAMIKSIIRDHKVRIAIPGRSNFRTSFYKFQKDC